MDYRLFEKHSGHPKDAAQRNLGGRTHYVDDGTLQWHKSRILECYVVDNGLLLAIVESVALDMGNTKRGYRYVVFDVFGHVVSRVSLENCSSTKREAVKAMWAWLNQADAKAFTLEGITKAERMHAFEIAELRRKLDGMTAAAA